MAVTDTRQWSSRFPVLIRLVGLVGLLAALVGVNLAHIEGQFANADSVVTRFVEGLSGAGTRSAMLASYLIAIGGGLALLVGVLEVVQGLRKAAFRRNAAGAQSLVQVALAVGLLIGVNWFSFYHFARLDCTRTATFTLPDDLVKELRGLRGETTIVVLQQRKKTELAADEYEDYDAAAEGVLIEKIRDLAEQFRLFSKERFQVVILDARKKEYRNRRDEVTRQRPELLKAIREAPENSILFHTIDRKTEREHVQRLSFDGFLQLDKTASRREAGKENLVLRARGIEPIKTRLINLEQRRPRVGFVVMHPLLSTHGDMPMYTAEGLRKALTNHGFEVRDIILKSETSGEAIVSTYEEARVEDLIDQRTRLERELPVRKRNLELFERMAAELPKADLKDFSRRYAGPLGNRPLEDEDDRRGVLQVLQIRIAGLKTTVEESDKLAANVKNELKKYDVEAALAERRLTDLRGKLDRLLGDCDLIIVPRYTRLPQWKIDGANEFFQFDETQLAALKDFLKKGKPMLACLSPINERSDSPNATPPITDSLEKLLGQLGIHVGPQTVLFDMQAQDMAERRRRRFQDSASKVPSIAFPSTPDDANALAESLRLTGQLAGTTLDIPLHYPRPVYFDPGSAGALARYRAILGGTLAHAPQGVLAVLPSLLLPPEEAATAFSKQAFLFSDRAAWNEDYPYPSREKPVPEFTAGDLKDPLRGTRDEKRRGPFPLGVAVQTTLPGDWYSASEGKPRATRLAVIGHGGIFVDPTLSPAREKVLLDTCNWLLGRDDLLNAEAPEWKYPRLTLESSAKDLWQRGAWLGLPLLFAFLGVFVLQLRSMR